MNDTTGRQKPLAIDLYCGLGGWTEGLLEAGWDVVGFDIERHAYGDHQYPAQLVIQDVRTLHGSQLRDAGLIVASPPCNEYSYMAMPWRRAKQIGRALKGEDRFPDGYKGSRTVDELNELFNACFRIQAEASEAKGEYVPLLVENVVGAQKWVGPARWRHGSFYLWGDVPALMPMTKTLKNPGFRFDGSGKSFQSESVKGAGGSWFNVAHNTTSGKAQNPDGRKVSGDWFGSYADMKEKGTISPGRVHGKGSNKRKAASAAIAKVPFDLAEYIGRVYLP